jgi:hypothetical protein
MVERIGNLQAYLFFGRHTVRDPSLVGGEGVPSLCLSINSTDPVPRYRLFKLEIFDYNRQSREVQVRLYVSQVLSKKECERADPDLVEKREIDTVVWVGFFDFPMIHNTRLSGGERCAVSLTELDSQSLELALAYFPGSRARLNYDEVMYDLIRDHRLSEPTKQ